MFTVKISTLKIFRKILLNFYSDNSLLLKNISTRGSTTITRLSLKLRAIVPLCMFDEIKSKTFFYQKIAKNCVNLWIFKKIIIIDSMKSLIVWTAS